MSHRSTIFEGIRKALAPLEERAAYPEYDPVIASPLWLKDEPDNAALFAKRLQAVGGKFFSTMAECGAWLIADGAKSVYIAPVLKELAHQLPPGLTVTHEYDRTMIDQIDAALTPATFGIAESGTVGLTDKDTPDRLAALAPWRHVAVLYRDQIVRTIPDALASLPSDPNIVFVTGPSKTADVEGILIQGVHGPGQQACLLI
jgi:L-lactate dehydrogenase complex protein LldG